MRSNFDFINENFPVLAQFGKTAEKYLYSDANSCLMKLGMIGETIVNLMFTYDRICLPQENSAAVRINILAREGLLTRLGIRLSTKTMNHYQMERHCFKWRTVYANGL